MQPAPAEASAELVKWPCTVEITVPGWRRTGGWPSTEPAQGDFTFHQRRRFCSASMARLAFGSDGIAGVITQLQLVSRASTPPTSQQLAGHGSG